MSSGSKHRRVKSIARSFESTSIESSISSTSTGSSAHQESIGASPGGGNSISGTSPPSLHNRASSSSIQTLAATFEPSHHSASSNSINGGDEYSSNMTSSRRPSNAYDAAGITRRYASESSSIASSSGNGNPRGDGGDDDDNHNDTQYTNGTGTSTPTLESAEQEDEFLPMTSSPFTPGYSMSGSPTSRRDSYGNISPEAPASLTAAERREHSRRHSRIHERNLSVFFPRPEQAGLPGYAQRAPEDTNDNAPHADVPVAQTRGWGFANGQQQQQKPYLAPSIQVDAAQQNATQPNTRRGHHHRHSMSHNFFPFLDGSPRRASGNMNMSPQRPRHASGHSPTNTDTTPLPSNLNTPKSVPAPASRHRHTTSDPSLIPSISSLNSRYAHLPLPIRFSVGVLFHLPFFTQLVLLVSCLEIALGASLWISGQSGESLAVTGLGYLVTFDGLAAISSVIVEGNAHGTEKLWSIISGRRASDNAVRWPYGTSRVNTLSHFAQCVYLIFSAVYVCKESIEHVLLLHGPDEMMAEFANGDTAGGEVAAHGAAHGGMGHGEIVGHGGSGDYDDLGVLIPTQLLVFATLASIFLAIAAKNHSALTEAVGPATYSLPSRIGISGSKSRVMASLHVSIISNPFTLTVIIFASTLTISSILIPAQQLAPLDKVVALLESIAMFYIAYPAAVTTGKVLLQTAPPGIETLNGDMGRLKRVMEEIENHASVVYLPTPHIWQLNPHPPPVPALLTKPSAFGRKSFSQASSTSKEAAVTVITLNIQVKKESTDDEILRLTNWARERCLSAITTSSSSHSPSYGNGGVDLKTSQRPGGTRDGAVDSRQQQRQVELTVQVMRFEEDRALEAEFGYGSHNHGHGHSHDHGHGHSHDHDAHSHANKEHGATTSHVISHEHEPPHSHSHDAHSGGHGHHH